MTTVTVMGLGPMGRGIAGNLLDAGNEVTVWNRTASAADVFVERGARCAASPVSIATETILSVLPDIDQFRDVTGDPVWKRWQQNGVRRVVVMSTTSPTKVRDLARDLAGWGIVVADAPLSGGEHGALAGTLSIMVGCAEGDWESLRMLLSSTSSRIERFGEPGAGSIAKLCNQIVVAGTLTSLAESLALAERAGIDVAMLVGMLENGLAASAVLDAKKQRLITRDYIPSGSAVNQLKDLRYVAEISALAGGVLPVTEAITPLFAAVVAEGDGDLDHTVVLEQLRRGADDAVHPR